MQASLRGLVTATPPMLIAPSSGATRPAVSRNSVVLPQPDGPSSVTSSPLRTLALMRSSATISAAGALPPFRRPLAGEEGVRIGKNLLTPS